MDKLTPDEIVDVIETWRRSPNEGRAQEQLVELAVEAVLAKADRLDRPAKRQLRVDLKVPNKRKDKPDREKLKELVRKIADEAVRMVPASWTDKGLGIKADQILSLIDPRQVAEEIFRETEEGMAKTLGWTRQELLDSDLEMPEYWQSLKSRLGGGE